MLWIVTYRFSDWRLGAEYTRPYTSTQVAHANT